MRILLIHIAFLIPLLASSQFFIGDSTRLSIGAQAILYTGGDATLNGPLTNSGTISANRNINFRRNQNVGSLRFIGNNDQSIFGDTITVANFTLDKAGRLILLTAQVRVAGMTAVENGVVQSDDELDLIQIGTVDEDGQGFVEGKMVGRLGNTNTLTFPMGLTDQNGNGFKNYLTLTATNPGTFIRVVCRRPNPALLFPDSTINGIAEEVEWVVSVVGTDSVRATLDIDYSGLRSLAGFVGNILADIHIPAIAQFIRQDTLHRPLNSATSFDVTTSDPAGRVASSEQVWITPTPKRFSIALVPSASEPIFYIPNVFAPNAVFAENKFFRPFYAGPGVITRVIIRLVDSFNQVVYEVDDSGASLNLADYGWNGVLPSGLDAPDGVYYIETMQVQTSARQDPYTNMESDESAVRAVLLVR